MQFMDDAIWEQLLAGVVSPNEAYMKAIDKSRFQPFLPPEDAALANAAGGSAENPAEAAKQGRSPATKGH
jgi:twitching motility protein PilT